MDDDSYYDGGMQRSILSSIFLSTEATIIRLYFSTSFSFCLSLETMLSARFGDGLVDKYFAYLVMLTIVDLLDRFEILCFDLYVYIP